ncbi:hypothetical protein ABIB99_008902 [Bradyrhizobium sp. LA6.1]|uniref:hypothetical protein n=1 Tax=Bradyrhizobium sp. LA6.1 TaxID=3156378 RepID=UPI0033966FFF
MDKVYSNLPEVRASETDPPQIGMPSVITPVLPIKPGESGTGRLGSRKTVRSVFVGFFKWKKLRFWFRGKREVVVEEIR